MLPAEAVILCEGYYDRAFWAALLLQLGCTDASLKPGRGERLTPVDAWGDPIEKGEFAFLSGSGNFIRITKCGDRISVLRRTRQRVAQRSIKPLSHLVVNIDPDTSVITPTSGTTGLTLHDLLSEVRKSESAATLTADEQIVLDGGATKVYLVQWGSAEGVCAGLPNQQTLERLVCSAIAAAYPERGKCVQDWLDTRHEPPRTNVKEFAWSYMAGWYAGRGCDSFYHSAIWEDRMVRNELEARLRAMGAWQVVEALAS